VRPFDTTPAAHAAQIGWLRRLEPAARIELGARMSQEARDIARTGIASRHPEYSPADLSFALWRLLYGDELFRRAWPRAPLLDP
jgi:hypothetical protein